MAVRLPQQKLHDANDFPRDRHTPQSTKLKFAHFAKLLQYIFFYFSREAGLSSKLL